jgi:hypothetical protein
MTDIQSIQVTLLRMAELLRRGGRVDWACALEKYQNEIVGDPTATKARILSLYGGMGSLNDLILYSRGTPLVSENNEMDILRLRLYELCRA